MTKKSLFSSEIEIFLVSFLQKRIHQKLKKIKINQAKIVLTQMVSK